MMGSKSFSMLLAMRAAEAFTVSSTRSFSRTSGMSRTETRTLLPR